jgi:hypothetical protein
MGSSSGVACAITLVVSSTVKISISSSGTSDRTAFGVPVALYSLVVWCVPSAAPSGRDALGRGSLG